MSEDFDPYTAPLEHLDDEIADLTGKLIDVNAGIMNDSREMAREMLGFAARYRELAEMCEQIATMHAIGARRVADINADIITAEWGITEASDGEDEELSE